MNKTLIVLLAIVLQPVIIALIAGIVVVAPLIFIYSLITHFSELDKLKKQLKKKVKPVTNIHESFRASYLKLYPDQN